MCRLGYLSSASWGIIKGYQLERNNMWYLDIALTVVMVVGLGVCIYALAVGVVDLIAKVRADRANKWMDDYREWFNCYEDEREYYADIFENIIENFDEFNNYVDVDGVKVIRGVLSSYVDGVRSSKGVE